MVWLTLPTSTICQHVLVLGRVTSGPGGDDIVNGAREVLEAEFPELAHADRVPRSRRKGQAPRSGDRRRQPSRHRLAEAVMTPYHDFVSDDRAAGCATASTSRSADFRPPAPAHLPADAPRALIFSPHPDDECIIGGLPLRLHARSAACASSTSRSPRAATRSVRPSGGRSCEAACDYLGFDLVADGARRPRANQRRRHASRIRRDWGASVDVIAESSPSTQPAADFLPHDNDWNSTHIGTHHLVVDALEQQAAGFACHGGRNRVLGRHGDAEPDGRVERRGRRAI